MGLDNGITFRIRSEELNFERNYEVCYFRKYWGLRYRLIDALDTAVEYEVELTLKDMFTIKEMLSYYCDIEHVKEAELSTIWNNNEECHQIREQYTQLLSAIDYLLGNIDLSDFIDFLTMWRSSFYAEKDKQTEDILLKILESPPDDLELGFYFYDSY